MERGHPAPHFSMDFPARYDAYVRRSTAAPTGTPANARREERVRDE